MLKPRQKPIAVDNSINLSTTELLKTSDLNYDQILTRLELITNLLETGAVSFNPQEEEKFKKLIDKHKAGINSDKKVSEKYLAEGDIHQLNKIVQELLRDKYFTEPLGNTPPRIRKPWQKIRSSKDAEKLQEKIEQLTEVKQFYDEDGFKIKYRRSGTGSSTRFEFDIKFKDKKIDIIFNLVFKEDRKDFMQDVDHLFPEEFQIAMFRKFIATYPEFKEKFENAEKINCTQSGIINPQTLLNISKYLQILDSQDDFKQDSEPTPAKYGCLTALTTISSSFSSLFFRQKQEIQIKPKQFLESTPNQSNSYNFMQQLNQLLKLKTSPSNSPKLLLEDPSKVFYLSLKQTFR